MMIWDHKGLGDEGTGFKMKCILNSKMFYKKKVPKLKMSLLHVAILDVFPSCSGGSRRTLRMGGTPSK